MRATGRRKLILCALWTQICMAFPALDALREGYEVYPVVDAIGGKYRPYSAHGRGDPQAHIYRRRDGESWQPLTGGLPEPLPAMPYALLATDGRLFAGLANGQLWESRDSGDSWTAMRLQGETLAAVLALAAAADRVMGA